MLNSENLYYYHHSKEIQVSEFLKNKYTIFFNKSEPITIEEFLSFKSDDGLTNEEAIKSLYVTNNEKDNIGEGPSLKIKTSTKLSIPKNRASKTEQNPQLAIPPNKFKDINFKSKVLADLQNNRGYSITHPQKQGAMGNVLATKYPRISVWLWSRVLGNENPEEGWFDLTPFVSSVNTSVTKTGGNFSINLPPILCKFEGGKWQIDGDKVQFYEQSGQKKYLSHSNFFDNTVAEDAYSYIDENGDYVSEFDYSDNYWKRSKFLFDQIISPNDLVFIKFDMLNMEKDFREKNQNFLQLNSSYIPNKVYDMIGLVDTSNPNSSINGGSISYGTTVTGRDLIKPLIEDGTYFFASEYAAGNYGSKYLSTGSIAQFSFPLYRGIKEIIEFFIKELSKIRVIPNSLLSYGNGQGEGIWKAINLIVDKGVLNRKIVDSSISVAQGSLLSHFQKLCQWPLVEFYGDTYFDQYYFTIRVPPFTQKQLKEVITGDFTDEDGNKGHMDDRAIIRIYESQVLQESLSYSDNEVHTWFHIQPKEFVGGATKDVWDIMFPPKIFPELVEIFGSKPYQFINSYFSYSSALESEKPTTARTTVEQAMEDLKFLIETHVHLPFTRSGTISIIGDRRIKLGEYIYYAPTKEIFYVEGVSHTYNAQGVQNITTIRVSRGMVRDYILGKDGMSYFNIVNLREPNVFIEEDEKRLIKEDRVDKGTRRVKKQITAEDKSDPSIVFPQTKDSTVSLANVNYRLLNYLNQLPKEWKDKVVITSGSELSVRHKGQHHYTGDALDIRLADVEKYRSKEMRHLAKNDKLYQFIVNDPYRESYGIKVPPDPDHGTSPHIHLQVYENFRNKNDVSSSKKGNLYEIVDETYDYVTTVTKEVLTGNKVKKLDVSKTLANIKINKEVLNFFLQRRQNQF